MRKVVTLDEILGYLELFEVGGLGDGAVRDVLLQPVDDPLRPDPFVSVVTLFLDLLGLLRGSVALRMEPAVIAEHGGVLGLRVQREHQHLAELAPWVLELTHGGGGRLGVEQGLERSRLERRVVRVREHLVVELLFQSGNWNVLETRKGGKAVHLLELRTPSLAIDADLEIGVFPRRDSSPRKELERAARVEVGEEDGTRNARHLEDADLPVPHLDLMVKLVEESSHLILSEEVGLRVAATFLESLFVDLLTVGTSHTPIELDVMLVPHSKTW